MYDHVALYTETVLNTYNFYKLSLYSMDDSCKGEEMNKPRLFISHSWRYDDYENLTNLLNNRGYFDYQESSVPSSDPLTGSSRQIWEAIENKIRWAQVILLTAGVYATYSGSIKQEIEFAKSLNKPVIAIVPLGNERTSALCNYASETVSWRADSIVDAIRRYI